MRELTREDLEDGVFFPLGDPTPFSINGREFALQAHLCLLGIDGQVELEPWVSLERPGPTGSPSPLRVSFFGFDLRVTTDSYFEFLTNARKLSDLAGLTEALQDSQPLKGEREDWHIQHAVTDLAIRFVWRARLLLMRRRTFSFLNPAASQQPIHTSELGLADFLAPAVAEEASGLRLYRCRADAFHGALEGQVDQQYLIDSDQWRECLIGIGRNGRIVEARGTPSKFDGRMAAARYRATHSARVSAQIAATPADPELKALANVQRLSKRRM